MRLLQGGIAAGFVCFALTGATAKAQDNEAYVHKIYVDLLGRHASGGEIGTWADRLYSRQASHDQFRAHVLGSEEFFRRHGRDGRRFVTATFGYLFGSQPTERDIDFWWRRWEQSGNRETVAYEMIQAATNPRQQFAPPPREEYRRDDYRRDDYRRDENRGYDERRNDYRRDDSRRDDIRRYIPDDIRRYIPR